MKWLLLATACVTGLALGGCGDDGPPAASDPESLVLSTTWQREFDLTACAPAAVRIAISAQSMELPDQHALADELGDTHGQGTDDLALVTSVLNEHLVNGAYETRTVSDPPTDDERAQLKSDLVERMADGYAMVAFVWGPKSIGRAPGAYVPPFYPRRGPPHHFIAIVGYEDYAESVIVSDPASGDTPVWGRFPETYSVTLDDFLLWMSTRGYTG